MKTDLVVVAFLTEMMKNEISFSALLSNFDNISSFYKLGPVVQN